MAPTYFEYLLHRSHWQVIDVKVPRTGTSASADCYSRTLLFLFHVVVSGEFIVRNPSTKHSKVCKQKKFNRSTH